MFTQYLGCLIMTRNNIRLMSVVVEFLGLGGGVTAQILYADNFKMYIRTFLGKEDARWTAWTQV